MTTVVSRFPDGVPAARAERPQRFELAPGLAIRRIVTGLWQVADIWSATAGRLTSVPPPLRMAAYARAGFDTFDMADHYGTAEEHSRVF